MRFGAINPKWRTSGEIGTKSFQLYYGHPARWEALNESYAMHAVRAKSAKNDPKSPRIS
jgi:hypothetical protein